MYFFLTGTKVKGKNKEERWKIREKRKSKLRAKKVD